MNNNRRQFIQQSSALAATGWLTTLSAMQKASAATTGEDYKALVCVFLAGGMDHANAVPPSPTTATGAVNPDFAAYTTARPGVAFKAADLAYLADATDFNNPNRKLPFALSPQLPKLRSLFNQGQAAILMNVGPVLGPTVAIPNTSPPQYTNPSLATAPTSRQDVPARLASHNDQQLIWQTSGVEGTSVGWGGLMSDKLSATYTTGNATFRGLGVNEAAPFLAGNSTIPLQVSSGESMSQSFYDDPLRSVVYGSSAVSQAAAQIFAGLGTVSTSMSYLEQNIVAIHKRAVNADNALRNVTATNFTEFQALNGDLAKSLRNVARAIEQRTTLNAPKRQVFFVTLGGWDTHSAQPGANSASHTELDNALFAFHQTMVGLGLSSNVTVFTASDFGRTLQGNGDGTDHGWGGHHFIVGGAVNGGKIYGAPLSSQLNAINTTRYGFAIRETLDRGVAVPTTSVHQYAATLANWMNVTDLSKVIPAIDNYGHPAWPRNLGFMKA